MGQADLKEIVEALRGASSFLIATHANPDGDAVGSMLALRHLLGAMGKHRVCTICNDPVPRRYAWLPGAGDVRPPDRAPEDPPELAILIDVGQLERIGSAAKAVSACEQLMVIDHHLEKVAEDSLHFVDATYAAAGEIVVDLFDAAGIPMTKDAAECAYVALTTDTGGFRFGNTNARSHRSAAKLLEAGVDAAAISGRVFDVMSRPKFRLLCRVLQRMAFGANDRYAYSYVNGEDMTEAGAASEDMDGLVNFARNIDGVQVGILFRRLSPETVKVSLRSSGDFDSADALRSFGGGGHKGAAGATLKMSFAQAQESVLSSVRERLAQDE